MDLQGPKLRVGKFAQGKVQLHRGQALRLDLDPTPGDERRVNCLTRKSSQRWSQAWTCCWTTASCACEW